MTIKKLQKQLFGTNGVRGVVGKEITPELALRIGEALGTMRQGSIAVGLDTRTSGPALADALKAGLLATGCEVVDCGVLPDTGPPVYRKGALRWRGNDHGLPQSTGVQMVSKLSNLTVLDGG